MEEIFENRDKNTEENYYKILGCDQSSSTEQIQAEFKRHALTNHPDKNLEEQSKAHEKFELILNAKETLCDPELRKKYDHWLNSGIGMSWKSWLEFSGKNQMVFHWTAPKKDPAIMCNEEKVPSKSENISSKNDDILHKFRTYQI